MKKYIIIIAGIISVVVLVSVQAFIINQIWLQKDELFQMKYKNLSLDALESFEQENKGNGFDTAVYLIDYYSEYVLRSDEFLFSEGQEKEKVNGFVISEVSKLLNNNQYLTSLLTKFFHDHGFDGDIKTHVVVNYFDLIDIDTTHLVYVNEDYLNSRTDKSKILVNRFKNELNHHRLSFDFYIDITDKRAIILREMLISLIMSSMSIFVVVIIFFFAYKYLREEQRLSDLKTDFINNMTHELKTPLSTITVASKTLEIDQILSDRERIIETARMIGKQSVNLNQLINLILEISIWERTEFEAEIKQMAVGPVLSDIIDSFRTGNRDSALINSNISLEGISIKADLTYFTTMINNLLSNAIKYSPSDCVVDVEAHADNTHVTINIKDNGIGISKNDQKHIFDKFYRVSHGNIHKTKGLGLGLYYVSRIVKAHGGTVDLESQPGKGSTFTIRLPII